MLHSGPLFDSSLARFEKLVRICYTPVFPRKRVSLQTTMNRDNGEDSLADETDDGEFPKVKLNAKGKIRSSQVRKRKKKPKDALGAQGNQELKKLNHSSH